jgi:hypothetical protein
MAGTPTKSDLHQHQGALTLTQIADELEAEGLEVEQLRDLTEELSVIERPPGLLRRVTRRARSLAIEQWSHLRGELEESREAMALLRARSERELNDEERAQVREQMLDLVRLFPAGLIAALNGALPVPGTSVFTPWLLVKLGLMPSRWRESHLLDQLRKQQLLLSRTGHSAQAERIGEILLQLETEADQRELIQRETRLLTHWDENRNGLWDETELAAYGREVDRVRALVVTHAARKQWFFEHEGEVYGASRLSELDDLNSVANSLLVCFDGRTGWVALEHVLDEAEGSAS